MDSAVNFASNALGFVFGFLVGFCGLWIILLFLIICIIKFKDLRNRF